MSELTTGGFPASDAAEPVSGQPRAKPTEFIWTIILLLVLGLASLVLAEQIATGWLPLGERANIARSNYNVLEIASIVGLVIWGVASLWTAIGFWQHPGVPSMEEYFEKRAPITHAGVLLTVAFLAIIGVLSLVIAEQVATGWIALGERVNIARGNINWVEWLVIIVGVIWGAINLRTVYGVWERDKRVWAWAQWVVLIQVIVGVIVLLNGLFDIYTIIPRGGSFIENLGGTQELTGPGLLLFLSALAVYRYLSINVDTTAAEHIRNRLAKTPGAGAIIGFLAILLLFSLASDLFLEQRSLAGIMATNITRGVVAIGITFLMISGEFDLSVGSVFGVGALIFLLTMTEGLPLNLIFGVAIVTGIVMIGSGLNGRRRWLMIGLILAVGGVVALIGIPRLVPAEDGLSAAGFTLAQDNSGGVALITTVLPAAIIALLVSAGLGAANGMVMIWTGIPSFIVTLGTLLAYRAILLVVVADGRILRYADYRLPPPFVYFNRYVVVAGAALLAVGFVLLALPSIRDSLQRSRQRLADYSQNTEDFRDFYLFLNVTRLVITIVGVIVLVVILGSIAWGQFNAIGAGEGTTLAISFFDIMNGQFDFVASDVNLRAGVLWWFLLVILFQFVLTQTPYGNHVQAVGGNPGAARAQGIAVNRTKVVNFMICSTLAALAGIISVSRLANVDPLMGEGLELEVIAASVIGGALLSGGYGSIVGALLGVLIFGMLQTGLVLIGVDSRAFSGVVGIIIIVAVIINTAVNKQRQ